MVHINAHVISVVSCGSVFPDQVNLLLSDSALLGPDLGVHCVAVHFASSGFDWVSIRKICSVGLCRIQRCCDMAQPPCVGSAAVRCGSARCDASGIRSANWFLETPARSRIYAPDEIRQGNGKTRTVAGFRFIPRAPAYCGASAGLSSGPTPNPFGVLKRLITSALRSLAFVGGFYKRCPSGCQPQNQIDFGGFGEVTSLRGIGTSR